MADQKSPSALATAALMEVIARGQSLQAAIVRGAGEAEIAKLRGEAHDVLDAYLDHTSAAAQATKAILEP